MTAKKRALNIFDVLGRLSKKDTEYYESLQEHEQKEIQPFVLMRWLTGTRDPQQIYFINELVNRFAFDLGNHKALLMKLMTVATSGKPQRYQWKKPASKKVTGLSTTLQVIKQYYNYNTTHAIDVIGLLSNDDIMGYAEELGLQKEDIAKLKKELKARNV